MEPARIPVSLRHREPNPGPTVALVAPDRTAGRGVVELLSSHYNLTVVRRLGDLAGGPAQAPGLIVLDLAALPALPRPKEILRDWRGVPVLALVDAPQLETAGSLLTEWVHDFLVRPFTATELLLRVHRALRRSPPSLTGAHTGEFACGDFRVNLRTGEVYHGDRALALTRKEVALLYALARRMGATVTRDELLNEVWGADYEGTSNVLDVHIRYLRRKIEPVPEKPQYILTVRGVGYRCCPDLAGPGLLGRAD